MTTAEHAAYRQGYRMGVVNSKVVVIRCTTIREARRLMTAMEQHAYGTADPEYTMQLAAQIDAGVYREQEAAR